MPLVLSAAASALVGAVKVRFRKCNRESPSLISLYSFLEDVSLRNRIAQETSATVEFLLMSWHCKETCGWHGPTPL